MPRVHLTERVLDRLKAPAPSGKQTLYWCDDLKGFGVLVSGVTSAKTYIVQREVRGKTRRVTVGPCNVLSLQEARKKAEAVLGQFLSGIDPKHGRRGVTTLRQALDRYLEARHSLRPKSAKDMRGLVENYLTDWLDQPLRDITGDMVEKRHRSIRDEVAAGGRYAGEAISNNALRALGTLWTFVSEREPMPAANPVQRLRRQWFPVHRRERIVRAEEMPRFYRAVQALASPVARDYLLFLMFTGLRRSEAATLTWADIDFSARVIRIPRERTKAGRKLDLPMTDIVRDMLVARRQLGDARWVFPSTGKAGHLAEPKFPLQEVARATGIRVSAHDLRRTFVTVAESCDISPLALSALVNHAVGGGVTGGYVQMTPERLREPAQRVANRLKELCGIASAAGAVPLRQV